MLKDIATRTRTMENNIDLAKFVRKTRMGGHMSNTLRKAGLSNVGIMQDTFNNVDPMSVGAISPSPHEQTSLTRHMAAPLSQIQSESGSTQHHNDQSAGNLHHMLTREESGLSLIERLPSEAGGANNDFLQY